MSRHFRKRGALLAGLMLVACGGSTKKAASWPPGTVLVVDGLTIAEAEVDAHVAALLDIKPAFSLTQRRRLIVINWSFPMAYGRAHSGAAREQARQRAEAWLRAREMEPAASAKAGGEGQLRTGNWESLGFDIWLMARNLKPGQSTGLVELPGRFAVIELVSRDDARNLALEQLVLSVEEFPYGAAPELLVENCSKASLEIVDPAWREVVPGFYKYRMEGGLE